MSPATLRRGVLGDGVSMNLIRASQNVASSGVGIRHCPRGFGDVAVRGSSLMSGSGDAGNSARFEPTRRQAAPRSAALPP